MTHHDFPQYSVSERMADGVVHVLSIGASLAGVIALYVMAAGSVPPASLISLSIYAVGLFAVFCFSAAYNLTGVSPIKALLKRIDQATVFFKIASTYTPFMVIKLAGWPATGFLAVIWSVATFGMTTKLFFPGRLNRTSYVLYLALGWCGVLILFPLFGALTVQTLLLLLAGGILYTVGVAFHLSKALRYQNAIWHVFVLAGAACHYAAVIDAVGLG
ncbi:MAG: hemolysin III family protein [Alphaproteobacteria bacterium]|nr:hemolysin III family protein [Alphaproteobacteria bacterium]